ncbi:T9SS type A sorting domain-containing protein [Flavobacterium sp.]|uniref:T9SS type A sorting domain-containing protein n=1 Tax=Flavobacterium sp. TaxID=239 RepID=UPI0012032EEC|nr:T9SS type A sorting domain-containing protein [Flavobacterium sp.]RZJ72573.1 MAG: T9SS type A sorting domain-containing protein [Flavobacterium sp.]
MISFRTSRKLLPLLGLLLPLPAFSQDIQWERSYGGKHADYLFDAVPTADYGFILAGSSLSGKSGNKTSANNGNLDYWIWKMDEKGEAVWQKSFGGSGIDLLQSIRLTRDGGFILAGTSNSPKSQDKTEDSKGGNDFWVIKLDAGGGERWQKTIGGYGSDQLVNAVQTRDGGFLLAGTSSSDANGDKSDKCRGGNDIWLVKLDNAGSVKWQKTFGGAFDDELRSVVATSDGGYLVGAYSTSSETGDKLGKCFGAGDFWLLRLDDKGDVIWQQTFGGAKDDELKTVIQTNDGNFMVAGYSNSGAGFNKTTSSRDGSDFWVLKIDTDGQSLWQESYDFGKYDVLTSIIENTDGTLLIAGHAKSDPGKANDTEGTNDYIALKVAADGREIWSRTLGSDGEDVLYKLVETRDGGYLLAGTSNPEAVKKSSSRKGSKIKKGLAKVSNGQHLAVADKAQQQMDGYVNDTRSSVNDHYKEQTSELSNSVNDALGQKDGPAKFSVGGPGDLLKGRSGENAGKSEASGNAQSGATSKKLPASRQKSNNLGKTDFWVVKLKDKDKKEKPKKNIEAFPNPTAEYTNVVVGYEFDNGTATVFDISGRQLQSFPISEQTVPVNLQGLPEGIYIVNIRTNKSDDSVKVMKTQK